MLYIDHRGGIALELSLLIGQSIPTELTDLNSKSLPDTFYLGLGGESHGSEIKQPGEVLGSLSNVEEQLSREYPNVDHLSLLIAGIVIPGPDGGTKTLSWYADNSGARVTGIRGGGFYKTNYNSYRAWVEAIERWGIRVIELPNKLALATHLVAMYQWDQKTPEEHHTFQRPLRTKQILKQWQPEVLTLMGLCDPATGRTFLGPEMAEALVSSYSSVASALNAPCTELATVQMKSGRKVGPVAAAKILAAVGRSDA